jgi:hypothetical protein
MKRLQLFVSIVVKVGDVYLTGKFCRNATVGTQVKAKRIIILTKVDQMHPVESVIDADPTAFGKATVEDTAAWPTVFPGVRSRLFEIALAFMNRSYMVFDLWFQMGGCRVIF